MIKFHVFKLICKIKLSISAVDSSDFRIYVFWSYCFLSALFSTEQNNNKKNEKQSRQKTSSSWGFIFFFQTCAVLVRFEDFSSAKHWFMQRWELIYLPSIFLPELSISTILTLYESLTGAGYQPEWTILKIPLKTLLVWHWISLSTVYALVNRFSH